ELIGHEGPVLAVTVSPDGRLAASGGADGRLRLWMLAERRTVHSFEGHTGPVWDVAFSPDGKTLLSAGADGVVKLWDIAAEDEVGTGDAGQSAPAAASRGKGGMGASMFRKCSACHSVTADGENKAGP